MVFFFFIDTATTEIYTLSLHDALPISKAIPDVRLFDPNGNQVTPGPGVDVKDRKSTRLNSSHTVISYAVFCLKKKITIARRQVDGERVARWRALDVNLLETCLGRTLHH